MFRQWIWIGMLVLMVPPLSAQQFRGFEVVPTNIVSEQRVALVIGNQNYRISPLSNPENDATAMARALRQCGFTVIQYTNLNRQQMQTAVQQFGNRIRRSGVGLFYYSGHGIQVAGQNYLVPVDGTPLNREIRGEELDREYLNLNRVLGQMGDAENRVNILILDACRNNKFTLYRTSEGLSEIEAPRETFIAYATAPGRVALDQTQRRRSSNSPYTTALMEVIHKPGLKIEEVFKQVRKKVIHETNEVQQPWDRSALTQDFYFSLPSSSSSPNPSPNQRPDLSLRNNNQYNDYYDFDLGRSDYEQGVITYDIGLRHYQQAQMAYQMGNRLLVQQHNYSAQQNYNQAAQWFHSSAQRNYAPAQHALGLMAHQLGYMAHLQGNIPIAQQEYIKAAQWFCAAVQQGYAPSQYYLGWMHYYAQGVPKNVQATMQLWQWAAQQGYAPAQQALGY